MEEVKEEDILLRGRRRGMAASMVPAAAMAVSRQLVY